MAGYVRAEICGSMGLITLNRPQALNALNLEMVRDLMRILRLWADDTSVAAVAIRGSNKEGVFGAFCAGGDIRFFHQAAISGNPALEDFFTEEYALNHLIHTYPKPYVAFMDGIVMGGGMGISQGASHRVVTRRTKMAMPETNIGLFPDVGGGYFLSRCPGHSGEWLALTGETLDGPAAVAVGLADMVIELEKQAAAWDALAGLSACNQQTIDACLAAHCTLNVWPSEAFSNALETADHHFSAATVAEILRSLESADDNWAKETAAALRKRSPLMLHVVLEQVRRARSMSIADDLRMERDLVRHCFFTAHLGRAGSTSETVEGIRALAVDKDHSPRWNPTCIEDVTPDMVEPFFQSPWPPHAHPLAALA